MINIAICDDEPYILDDISGKISEFMKKEKVITNITCFESGNALLETECDFDIIFLDIQMNGTDGMKTAQELRRRLFKGVPIYTPYQVQQKPILRYLQNKAEAFTHS